MGDAKGEPFLPGSVNSEDQHAPALGRASSTFKWASRVTKTLRIPAGSLRSSVFTLLTSTVGSGVLSLPYAASRSGVICTVFLIIAGACAAYYMVWMLITVSTLSARDGGKRARTYQELAQRSGGERLAKATRWILIVNLFGTTVAYMVVIATLVPAAIQVLSSTDISQEWYLQRWFVLLLVTVTFEVPLGLQENLSALRYTALIAIFWSIYLMVITMYEYFHTCGGEDSPECFSEAMVDPTVLWGPFGFEGLSNTVPIIVFSFTCHPNVLPIYLELLRPTPERMFRVTKLSFLFCVVIYVSIGVFGYLTFTDATMGDYLLNDYKHKREVLAGGFGLVISVALCIPLFVNAGRFNILQSSTKASDQNNKQPSNPLERPFEYDKIDQEDDEDDIEEPGDELVANSTFWTRTQQYFKDDKVIHYTITLTWLALSYGIASSVDDIAVVISIMGSTTIPLIGYILPPLFLFGITERNEFFWHKVSCTILSGTIVLFAMCNLGFQIQTWISG